MIERRSRFIKRGRLQYSCPRLARQDVCFVWWETVSAPCFARDRSATREKKFSRSKSPCFARVVVTQPSYSLKERSPITVKAEQEYLKAYYKVVVLKFPAMFQATGPACCDYRRKLMLFIQRCWLQLCSVSGLRARNHPE